MEHASRFNGTKLRQLRKLQGWSLEELSKRSGLSVSHLSALEKGRRKSPSVDLIYDLAEAFPVSIYFFLDQTDGHADDQTDAAAERFLYPVPPLTRHRSQQDDGEDAQFAQALSQWSRTLRPDTIAFMLQEEAQEYLVFAQKLHASRHSSEQVLQLVSEFIHQASLEEPRAPRDSSE
ncbi:MAG: helix-turn-helix domain-containing protein [Bacilli bacterium]